MSTYQELSNYKIPAGWKRASLLRRSIWLLFGKPIVESWLPGTFWRRELLKIFGARIGLAGRIKPNIRITSPWLLTIGDHCWLGEGLWIDNLSMVTIGDQVCISQGVYLCTGNHNYKAPSFDLRLGSITIDSQAWIAAKSVIAPGTHVGEGSVVALASVASGTIPPGVILRGNPAVIISYR